MANVQADPFWATQPLEPGEWCSWQAGTVCLWAKREQHEWRVTSTRSVHETEELKIDRHLPPPEGTEWKRWAFKDKDASVTVSPTMPDKPLVVRPDSPIRIPRGNEALFFISIPIHLQVQIGEKKNLLIYEEPSVVLSKTWFGPPFSGELSYALRTGGSREIEGAKQGRHRAICPVLITNKSEEELNFEKLSIRAMHVNIYRGENRLWTEEIHVSYRGEQVFSEVSFGKHPPKFETIRERLAGAREPMPKGNFFRKSFDSLWSP